MALSEREVSSEGRRIRALRMAAGLDQQDLAAQAGISVSVLSKIERGHQRPLLKHLDAIGKALAADSAYSAYDEGDIRHAMEGFLEVQVQLVGPGWAARESNPEPTDSASAVLESITYPEWGSNSTRNGEAITPLRRVA